MDFQQLLTIIGDLEVTRRMLSEENARLQKELDSVVAEAAAVPETESEH